jgi:hypothetical protein
VLRRSQRQDIHDEAAQSGSGHRIHHEVQRQGMAAGDFRANMIAADAPEIVGAIDERLSQLGEIALRSAIGRPLTELTLAERVHEAVRVYEEFLAYKHAGKRIRASRTNTMIKRWGEKEAVRRTVTNLTMSTGLELLAKYGRLDCAYEQIILDFPDEFDRALIAKARENLARLPKAPQPRAGKR